MDEKLRDAFAAVLTCMILIGCAGPPAEDDAEAAQEETAGVRIDPETARRIEAIHDQVVFADLHAHPSRFHRANVPEISPDEIALYRQGDIDVVVSTISTDAAYSGGYVERDGTRVERGEYRPEPGEAFAFTLDRLERVLQTIEAGTAVLAASPAAVLEAREQGKVALLPALEGSDGLEGKIENLHTLYARGVRLVQLVHFRDNELGHIMTYPYSPGGLTEFGEEVVREANRMGIIIDLAHANNQTIMDVLELSEDPVIFSHTGANALYETDRHVTDQEIRAIAAHGGVIGIWPNGSHIPTVAGMVRHIAHVDEVAGIDHVGIGSDLRGMSSYSEGFGEDANFHAIAAALLEAGFTDEEVGKVMGGNFFRVWQEVVAGAAVVARAN